MAKSKPKRTKAVGSDVPLPGRPVPGSESGRPIMAALSLLSRRWVLRILWELRDGACGFREMRTRCEQMSPDTLSTRLGELQEAGLVDRDEAGNWELTAIGRKLGPTLQELDRWSRVWERTLSRRSS